MKVYGVYAKDRFIDYFDSLYESRDFVARCLLVLSAVDSYQPGIFKIEEEDA